MYSLGRTMHRACLSLFFLLLSSVSFTLAGINTDKKLRILPLGDSITWGYQSSDGNGYRQDLLNRLSGNDVQYIGSQRSGSMANNANEGHPSFEINAIANSAQASLPQRPNVVLLMAGTNDVNNNDDVSGAPQRLASLVDQVITACPDAVVILAKITSIGDGGADARAQAFNAAIPDIVTQRTNDGKHIVLVDMHSAVTAGDLIDGLHPTDHGYDLMSSVWFDGLEQAASKDWIDDPVDVPQSQNSNGAQTCTGALFWFNPHGQIASGVGDGDKAFESGWNPVGTLASGVTKGANVRIADIDGDGNQDYLIIDDKSGAVSAYLNKGYDGGKKSINWVSIGQIASGIGEGAGVSFADIDGDGLADYLWTSSDGQTTMYQNKGQGGSGWNWISKNIINAGLASDRASVRWADLDGDGRADFVVVDDHGALTAWLNVGGGDSIQLTSMGEIATGTGSSDQAGVQLADLNNDGRADYCWLDKDGKMTAYINTFSDGVPLAPGWQPAGVIATGIGTGRDNITIADVTGDGKADYVFVHPDSGALEVYLNQGSGGRYQKGEQVIFADLDGDGQDDYVSIGYDSGSVLAYRNAGFDSGSNQWIWIPWGTIASGVAPGKEIHMCDFDGDKRADYAIVDKKSGAVSLYINGGQNSGAANGWLWISQGQVATGIGAGKAVRFADLNGDGKCDYLFVDPAKAGAVTAYINGGQNSAAQDGWNWIAYDTVATGTGNSPSDITFADLNGDGKADYIYTNRINGAVYAWYNGGGQAGDWVWYPQGQIASGVGKNGLGVRFGRVSGTGRADYLAISASSAAVELWQNGCDTDAPSGPPPINHDPKKPWQGVDCTSDGVTDARMDQSERWDKVFAESAWNDSIFSWQNDPRGGLTFPEVISNFFHGPDSMGCGISNAQDGCVQDVQCTEAGKPAGFMILNSMINTNIIFTNIYTAMGDAQTSVNSVMGTFANTFAPIDKSGQQFLDILFDFLALGYAAALTPVWAHVLKGAPFFQTTKGKPLADDIKDETNAWVTQGLKITHDLTNNEESFNNAADLSEAVNKTIGVWRAAVSSYQAFLYDGSQDSIDALHSLITSGKMMETGARQVDGPTITNSVARSVLMRSIPMAWSLSNKGNVPVVFDTGLTCTSSGDRPSNAPQAVSSHNWACVDTKFYYIQSARGREADCTGSVTSSHCVDQDFGELDGIDTLDGKTWNGLLGSDLVAAAVNTWTAAGKKNGADLPDPNDSKTLDAIYDQDVHAPGLVSIPVCSEDEARDNWKHGQTGKNYPCNS